MILLRGANECLVSVKKIINKNPFIKACLIISIAAIIFLLGTKVGNILYVLKK